MTTNNRAKSAVPPSNMAAKDIPMFVTITFDDALHGGAYAETQQILNHQNRNNEQIPLVYFVSNEYSDYKLIQDRYLQGCEIATHTVTHTTNPHSTISKLYHEIKHSRELISTHADIPINSINGFRAPFLETSDNMFKVLNVLNPQYLYDSSITSSLNENNLFDWPYTYDIYDPAAIVWVGETPKQSYKGLWEMPMYMLYSDIPNKKYLGAMDYVGDYDTILNSFKSNFEHRLNTNKAPMGLYFHMTWLFTNSNVAALNDFIDWVLNKNNTWIVTNKQVINWINNPIPNAQFTVTNNNQLMNGKTTFVECYYLSGLFRSVLTECPQVNPHIFEYDESQLIYSQIIITTTNDNILNTYQDICEKSINNYNFNAVYCSNWASKSIVRYNNMLYQCKWWTRGNDPSTSDVWDMVKNCITVTHSFVKGNIYPYGTVDVFLDSVLNINIQPYDGYVVNVDNIFVIINQHRYPIKQIFDNYVLSNDKLTILFTQIKFEQYQIEISF